jgi:hypothetical protein
MDHSAVPKLAAGCCRSLDLPFRVKFHFIIEKRRVVIGRAIIIAYARGRGGTKLPLPSIPWSAFARKATRRLWGPCTTTKNRMGDSEAKRPAPSKAKPQSTGLAFRHHTKTEIRLPDLEESVGCPNAKGEECREREREARKMNALFARPQKLTFGAKARYDPIQPSASGILSGFIEN